MKQTVRVQPRFSARNSDRGKLHGSEAFVDNHGSGYHGPRTRLIRLWSYPVSKFLSIVAAVLSVITSIFSYTKIYFTLRHHQAQVHITQGLQPNGAGIPPRALNIARYKKTVSSIAWVQLALLACYVPFFIGSTLLEVFQNMIISVSFTSFSYLLQL